MKLNDVFLVSPDSFLALKRDLDWRRVGAPIINPITLAIIRELQKVKEN